MPRRSPALTPHHTLATMSSSSRPTIYLFDVDGTLMTFHGAGRVAYRRALRDLVGRADDLLDFSFAGLTDKGLVRKALQRADTPVDDVLIEELLQRYADYLPEAIKGSDFKTHPGVHDLLDRLHQLDDVAIGLGTGNIEQGARLKLSYATPELNDYFSFGGFGSDAEQRDELLAAGARRGADALGLAVESCRVIVIGDTPLDVRAGRAIGARVVGVTSGGASHRELSDADPDHLFEHLADDGVQHALVDHDSG